jgi:hypothetical protein
MSPRYIARAYIVPARDLVCRTQVKGSGRAALFWRSLRRTPATFPRSLS